MNLAIKKEELEALREKYPKGCRVELVKMDDPYREMCIRDRFWRD